MHVRCMSNVALTSLLLLIFCVKLLTGSLCVTYGTREECNGTSLWAVNYNVSVLHNFTPTTTPPFSVLYEISSTILCEFLYLSSPDSCQRNGKKGANCGPCTFNYTSKTLISAELIAVNLNKAMNGSVLTYDLSVTSIFDQPLHTFTLAVCPKVVGNASALTYAEPCGYGCSSKFSCLDGFEYNQSIDSDVVYSCSSAAEWIPRVPINLCIPTLVPEPTTTETATTPTASTTSNGSKQDASTTHYATTGSTTSGDVGPDPNSGLILAVIGGVLAAICIGLFVYMAVTAIPNNVMLYAMFALCVCAWAIALGLCFGLSTNKSAVIAGIVLGSLALAGIVVIIVFQFLHKKSHQRKGIPGKAEEEPSL